MVEICQKIKLSSEQTAACLRFRKSMDKFLRLARNFEMKRNSREEIIKKTIAFRKGILEVKHESVLFLDFVDNWIEEIEEIKFKELKNEDIGKLRVSFEKNDIEDAFRENLTTRFFEKVLKDKNFSHVIFHLAEIYADYFKYKKILDDIISKKESLYPDLLHTYLAGDFYMLDWHTFGHIDDLVSFEDGEFIYAKGLMSNLSEFLEKLGKNKFGLK